MSLTHNTNVFSPLNSQNSVGSSSMDSDDHCLVCGRFTDALHFQITVCRACSAFYRRAIQTKKRYSCQKGTERCDLLKKVAGKPLCRYCRFKKCMAVGMRVDQPATSNVPDITTNIPQTSLPIDIPENLLAVKFQLGEKNVSFDWQQITDSVKAILNSTPTFIPQIHPIQLSEFQRFQIGLSRVISFGKTKEDFKGISENLEDKTYIIGFYQTYLTVITQMLTGLSAFMKLPLENRFTMFKHFWLKFNSVERLFATCQTLGYNTEDSRLLMDDRHVIDCLRETFSFSGLTPQEREKHMELNLPNMKKFVTYVMTPFKELKVTEIELAYCGLLLLWNIQDIENLDPKAHEYANEVIDKASSEIHHYYTYDLRTPNYALRLIKLTKIISGIQYLSEERKKIATMAQVFNLFTYDLSDCQIIDH